MMWRRVFCSLCVILLLVTACAAPSSSMEEPPEIELPDGPLYTVELPEFWSNETATAPLGPFGPYNDLVEKDETNWIELIDNETPLNELLDRNDSVMSTEMAWHCSVNKYDTRGQSEAYAGWSAYIYEALYGTKITFVRDTGKSYSSYNFKDGRPPYKKMYTAFRVEGGGIMFCFFDLREQDNRTIAKRAVWVTDSRTYADFEGIEVGDSAKAVAAVDPIARFPIANPTVKSTHLLQDGVIEFYYEDGRVSDVQYYSDFIVPNTSIFKGSNEARDLEIMISEALQYNLSVLPQDYPQS